MLGLGAAACGGSVPTLPDDFDPDPGADAGPLQPEYPTAESRAIAVAEGLVASAEEGPDGLRWPVVTPALTTYPMDLYAGQAGILTFLAEAQRRYPRTAFAETLTSGGEALIARPIRSSGLYTGEAGRAWALMALHDVLDDARWLEAALEIAGPAGADRADLPGDLIGGGAGQGLLMLRAFDVTKDGSWLDAARDIADWILDGAVSAGPGIKFPSFELSPGQTVYYTGLSHGAAGAAYFLARLAAELPEAESPPYLDAARAVAAWLDSIAVPLSGGLNWYRREPDQTTTRQVQWCHGAPGIGIFHAALHEATDDPAYLDVARACAAYVEAEGADHHFSVLCHGVAGNAELFLKLYRTTGEATWLESARAFGDVVWGRRNRRSHYPRWQAGDGTNVEQPSLLTGDAGIGWFYLQLASEGELGDPVTV